MNILLPFFSLILSLLSISCSINQESTLNLQTSPNQMKTDSIQLESWILYNCYYQQSAIAINNFGACPSGSMAATPPEHPLIFVNDLWYLHFRVLHNYPPNIPNYRCRIDLPTASNLQTGDESFYSFTANSIINNVNCETIGLHDLYIGEVNEDFTEIVCVFEPECWDCLCSAANDLIIPLILNCDC